MYQTARANTAMQVILQPDTGSQVARHALPENFPMRKGCAVVRCARLADLLITVRASRAKHVVRATIRILVLSLARARARSASLARTRATAQLVAKSAQREVKQTRPTWRGRTVVRCARQANFRPVRR